MDYLKQRLASITLLLLIFLSVATLYLYTVGVYTTFEIDLTDKATSGKNTDVAIAGKSTAVIEHTKDGLLLNCAIQFGYAWPFCQGKINLAEKWENLNFDASKGIDFSSFEDIFIKMKYEGGIPHRVRVYLRNYNSAYTDLDKDDNSMKINEIEFSPNRHPKGPNIPLNSFQVAGWWSSAREIPLEYAGAEFSNISLIEVSTPVMATHGPASILIQEISFRKQFIPKEHLLIMMILLWLVSALVHFVFRLHHSNATLQKLEVTLGELTKTQKQLVESEKLASLGNLVAGVAHEINTPLGVCITYTSVMADTANNVNEQIQNNQLSKGGLKDQIDTLIRSSEGSLHNLKRADKLITSFKHLAVNADTSEKARFLFSEVISDTVLTLQNTLTKSNHTVNVNCPEDLIINSYPGAISQILIGLIDNSIKHGFENIEKGVMNITVSKSADTLSMIYTDNGCGINEAEIKKIFEPFYTTKRNKGHVGLGLNTLHNVIIKMLNGKFAICSDGDNAGVIINISFPIDSDDGSE